ncbi:NAD(P)-dependent oxidoreductase [Nitrosopumilus sp. Nsub]|uniref:NAD-dependent epimerase/dehydratase family protein n=1 Tax=Nitrosopumilus sp. Nsub TaxID=1776294 RepID=UPI00083499F1|nr:NAD(P)-dependent oxidoreductase [Nitrosopumilus sp. Nsub]
MAKSVLVTGATGFIGSRLVEALINKEYDVTSLIREGKKGNSKSNIIYGDLTDEKIDFKDLKFDCIFHLASHTPLEKNEKILEKVNLEGTKKLFEEIKNITNSIIYISGLGVYGETGDKIINEEQKYNPNTNFVKIRLDAEKYLRDNSLKNNIDFAVVHFGDVYGPGGWFNDMLVKRLQKNTFRMPAGGDYYKGFVHVDDAVGSMIAVLEQKSFGESFIVADSQPVTFKEFSNFTADQIGAKQPGSVPTFLAKAVLGGDLIKLLTTSMKVSNEKISKIYQFKYPDYKNGIIQAISELKESNKI